MRLSKFENAILFLSFSTLITACGSKSNQVDQPKDHPQFKRATVSVSPAYTPSGEITDTNPVFSDDIV